MAERKKEEEEKEKKAAEEAEEEWIKKCAASGLAEKVAHEERVRLREEEKEAQLKASEEYRKERDASRDRKNEALKQKLKAAKRVRFLEEYERKERALRDPAKCPEGARIILIRDQARQERGPGATGGKIQIGANEWYCLAPWAPGNEMEKTYPHLAPLELKGGIDIGPEGIPEEGGFMLIPSWTDSEGRVRPEEKLWVSGTGKHKRLVRDPVRMEPCPEPTGLMGIRICNDMEEYAKTIANRRPREYRPGKYVCAVCGNIIWEGTFVCGVCGFWANENAVEYGRNLYIEDGNNGPGWEGRFRGTYGEEEYQEHATKFWYKHGRTVPFGAYSSKHGIDSMEHRWPLPCLVHERAV